jgi:hypothetical protein
MTGNFDFEQGPTDTEEQPVRRRKERDPNTGLLKAIFLLMLFVVLIVAGTIGWFVYDAKVRQPRFREISRLGENWYAAERAVQDDQQSVGEADGRLMKAQGGLDPILNMRYTDERERQKDLRELRVALEGKKYQLKESISHRDALDRAAQDRFGVKAKDLITLLPTGN